MRADIDTLDISAPRAPEYLPESRYVRNAWIARHSRIGYTGYDPKGRRIEREASGFHARVVQHECDHLDGILYPMRVRDFSRFGYTDVLFPDVEEAPAD